MPRIAYTQIAPDAFKRLLAVEEYFQKSPVAQLLLHLIRLRVSQINGCAYCIDMHWKDLRALGEAEQRLYGLDAWRESSYYTQKERAALAWAESVTLIRKERAKDEQYGALKAQFSEAEIVDITFAVSIINTWNRLAIGFRVEPGHYKSQLKPPAA